MVQDGPHIYSTSGRRFSPSVVGIVALIVDVQERFLMLSHPERPGQWEAISGALEVRETLQEGMLREVREEAGSEIRVQPLGVVHADSVRFDDAVTHLTSICFLLAYRGGSIVPSDDLAESEVAWLSVSDLADAQVFVPWNVPWIFERALQLQRVWAHDDPPELQPPLQ